MAGQGYQVALTDLKNMADTFHQQASNYRGLRPKVTPPLADGGDGGLNDAMKAVMDAIDVLHTKMADRIDDHGDKLTYAHDSYQRRDVDTHGVFEDLMGA